MFGQLKIMHNLTLDPSKFETYNEKDFKTFVSQIIAPEKIFKSKSAEIQNKINEFYLQKSSNSNANFYIEKYDQVTHNSIHFLLKCFTSSFLAHLRSDI